MGCVCLLGTVLLKPWNQTGHRFPHFLVMYFHVLLALSHSNCSKSRFTNIWCNQKKCHRFRYMEVGVLLLQIPENVDITLELGSGQRVEEFEGSEGSEDHGRKKYKFL